MATGCLSPRSTIEPGIDSTEPFVPEEYGKTRTGGRGVQPDWSQLYAGSLASMTVLFQKISVYV
jgi:hypothetical protein